MSFCMKEKIAPTPHNMNTGMGKLISIFWSRTPNCRGHLVMGRNNGMVVLEGPEKKGRGRYIPDLTLPRDGPNLFQSFISVFPIVRTGIFDEWCQGKVGKNLATSTCEYLLFGPYNLHTSRGVFMETEAPY